MEKGQRFSRVQRDEHLHEELLVLCLQRQREPVDDAVNGGKTTRRREDSCTN